MMTTQWSEPFSGPEMKALCLPDSVMVAWRNKSVGSNAHSYWDDAPHYHLPADHAAVTVALHNRKHGTSFAYWPGGDEAPGDWDQTRGVLLRNGSIHFDPIRWEHDPRKGNPDRDIIGYPKRTEQPAEVVGDAPDWAVERVRQIDDGNHIHLRNAFARYIAAHEEAPVDPDLLLAREICALNCQVRYPAQAHEYRRGRADESDYVAVAIDGIRHGRELAEAGK
jgi:hypothetical protein